MAARAYANLPLEESEDFKVPNILRRQGIRFGSTVAGQALSVSGGAITARGLALSRTTSERNVRKSSVVTKKQARTAERAGGAKYNPAKYDYRPERSSSAQRWLKRRYNPKPTRVPRGTLHIRTGSTMMVAGRLVPVLAVGYLAYELLPEPQKKGLVESDIGSGGSLRDRGEGYLDFGSDVYTGVTIGYAVGKGLLGAFFS